jgi:hypothetical protein
MSTYTDKVGYIVRYGGPEGIQWIKTGEVASSPLTQINPASAVNPVGLVIEATKAAALILQWWEMRKQTLLQTAQFDERRIPWLADMLFQWCSEANEGLVRLDTSIYFDREVSRLLHRIVETKLMDVPSSLLLQVERTAHAMSAVNRLVYGELHKQHPNFVLPDNDTPQLIEYLPFWELQRDDREMETYLGSIDKTIGVAGNTAIGVAFGLVGVAAWRFAVWNSARIAAEKRNRKEEFHSLTSIALELRSLRAQLSYAALLPAREKFLALPSSQRGRTSRRVGNRSTAKRLKQ